MVGCPPQLNEAQLLLHLYAAMGLDMLGRLQGQYAFCLYDSKQVRIICGKYQGGLASCSQPACMPACCDACVFSLYACVHHKHHCVDAPCPLPSLPALCTPCD